MMKLVSLACLPMLLAIASCASEGGTPPERFTGARHEVRLMTLDPGHFHAGLIQKYATPQIDSVVHVYAPEGRELEVHLALVARFNTRADDPTQWAMEVYRGDDYLERMLADRPGNVVVLAGNNGRKIDYLRRSVEAGLHVLADKPMIIYPRDFEVLKTTLETADARGLLVNDVMTERHEITSILQRELSQRPELFGALVPGTPEEPGVSKESVHHFYKTVAGQPLVRPAWFFDVRQQGEGIVDVSTHLVDLILWQVFPGQAIDYRAPADSVAVLSARSWDTRLTPAQFTQATQETAYPDFLQSEVEPDSTLGVAANGEFVFRVRGVHAKVAVRWAFENPGGGDTHYSIMRGTRANLVVRQDAAQGFRPTLYVEPLDLEDAGAVIEAALAALSDRYPGLTTRETPFGWEIQIPDAHREGHEEHFTRVAERYLSALVDGALPPWERTNLLTKYFITTQAYERSR